MSRNETLQDTMEGALSVFRRTVMEPFESYLASRLTENPKTEPLVSAMNYSLLSGGKRLRPLLCLATAHQFGVDPVKVFPVAEAIECIHTYSLIHDDLPCMDDDDLRRGRPTNHKVYGEAVALLAGDGLLTYAFETMTSVDAEPAIVVKMIQCLAQAAGPDGMVGGQASDMNQSERTLSQLQFIHRHKTGRLIQASLLLGAWMAKVDESVRNRLQTFGEHIGHAFQIMDDWLDVFGNTEELGKPVGSDQAMNKLTYPSLVGADETRRIAETEYDLAVAELSRIVPSDSLLHAIAKMMVRRRK